MPLFEAFWLGLVLTMTSLRYLLSRKERAKRKQARETESPSQILVPPAYKTGLYETPTSRGPRSVHPRPISSFAPDHSRQSHYQSYYQQQLPRASSEIPSHYPALPTYDPSKYQPVRSVSNPHTESFSSHIYPSSRGQSSRLSEVQYNDSRASAYHPTPPMRDQYSIPKIPRESLAASDVRRQTMMPPWYGASMHHVSRSGEGRERSYSEPVHLDPAQSTRGPGRPKPVLSRLITNFS
ncbi:hypothetical protein N7495_006860 [Penicillium taxi]|uniref:uncharacterized protein n=1 Tax=Penicillium taxi TaxID=168475 RepID=UPI002544D711|nr:uncharacterized protein N7495_006860 [Penicillium taxi]KAJ5895169.1 hypothetical protein N7495_006860 [Penicillium taxi]